MTDDPASQGIAKLTPRTFEFQSRVQFLAQNSSLVKWTRHARERMLERDIPIRLALTVLREGVVVGGIEPGGNPGEWKAKLVRNVKGRRDVGVVVLLVRNQDLVVKTVEWEDTK